MAQLKVVGREQHTPSVLDTLMERLLAEAADFPTVVAWLATPEVCEYLVDQLGKPLLPWWEYDSFPERLKKLPFSQALALFEPLAKTARWVEDDLSGEAWATESFLKLLLAVTPEKEKEFRQMLEYEIKEREDTGEETKVADDLVHWTAILKRIRR